MASAIQLTTSSNSFIPLLTQEREKLAHLMQEVIEKKQENVQSALRGRVNFSEGILIGGDLFSMGYLSFQGAQIIKPSLSAISAISITSLICGSLAGLINISVAGICLKEGIQAWKNGDQQLATRLFIDFGCFLGIGIIMILSSLATRIASLAAIGAFFAANPWLLPVLFFAVSLPVIYEIVKRIQNIWLKKDFAAQLKTENLPHLIEGIDENNPFHLKPLFIQLEKKDSEAKVKKILVKKMEQLQADMGVEAAIEAFKLIQLVLKQEKTKEQMAQFRQKITEWNRAQYVRLFQQVLYTAAFGVSLAMLANPKIDTKPVNAASTFSMASANAIPFYMDAFWPFKRNTPIVVPIV